MDSLTEHSKRWITAFLLLFIISIVAFLDITPVTWLFLGIVYLIALKESSNLFKITDDKITFIIGVLIWIISYFYPNPLIFVSLGVMVIVSITAYNRSLELKTALPILYPTVGMVFILMLYRDFGIKSLFWLLVIVALTDVGAYYTGKKFGKRGFSPTSPNKTVEGVYGGLFFGTLAGAILILIKMDINIFISILTAFITSIASIFGDLFESYLKREAGVKDSGTILPGHGGVLDRIDGYLFGSVTLYTALNLIHLYF